MNNTKITRQKLRRAYVILMATGYATYQFLGPTYTLFLKENGLSFTQLMSLNAVFMAVSFILDPFTGPLGDKIGQKKIYALGHIALAIGCVVYFTSSTLPFYFLAEIISAVGFALQSEALESWLRSLSDSKFAHKVIGRTSAMSRIASAPLAIVASYVGAKYTLSLPFLLGGVVSLLVGLYGLAIRLPDTKSNGDVKEAFSYFKQLKDGLSELVKEKELLFITVFRSILGFLLQPINMFWSIMFVDKGLPIEYIGGVTIALSAFVSLGEWLASNSHKVSRKYVGLLGISIAVPLVLTWITDNPYIIITGFLLHEIGRGALNPVTFTYANDRIKNENRFTMNSLRSSIRTAGNSLGLLTFGILADATDMRVTWIVSTVLIFILGLVVTLRNLSKRGFKYDARD